ncbi:Retrovirus-related Pol polyprotein from transposon TNT 1-94 [Porphyridium purpureum]|uniref:Retrovirus-related Pol polyprotein from transposon TNT 1-94 n=1 Tax=Porphyridium purpureum TaxID=35688 RepID=A0A5J4YUD3_PORPP|nr:Retrovirus-related Pol polyprotein from transposon TNT 1-94 [Porphyridium purpureum]|eukprot:POR4757..scf227_4
MASAQSTRTLESLADDIDTLHEKIESSSTRLEGVERMLLDVMTKLDALGAAVSPSGARGEVSDAGISGSSPSVPAESGRSGQSSFQTARERFLKLFPREDIFSGAPNGTPFHKWKGRFQHCLDIISLSDSDAKSCIPFTLSGLALTCAQENARLRLWQLIDVLGSTFVSKITTRAALQLVRQTSFDRFRHIGDTEVARFDGMCSSIVAAVDQIGPPHSFPASVAEYVVQAMLLSKHGSQIAISLAEVEGTEAISRIRLYLGRLDLLSTHANQTSYYIETPDNASDVGERHEDDVPSNNELYFSRPRPRSSGQPGAPPVRYQWRRPEHRRPHSPDYRGPQASEYRNSQGSDYRRIHTDPRVHFTGLTEIRNSTDQLEASAHVSADPGANNNSDFLGFVSDVYATLDCLPRGQKWTILVDTGSGRSLSGLKAYERYCHTVGQSPALEPADNDVPVFWGRSLPVIGRGHVRLPTSQDSFLDLYPVIVHNDYLPLIFGGLDQDKFQFDLLRTESVLRSKLAHIPDLPLIRPPGGQLALEFCSPLDIALYTADELYKLHKRFGHASAAKIKQLLRQAGEQVDPGEIHNFIELVRKCETCQWYVGRRTTYKVAANFDVEFNHVVQLDFVFITFDGVSTKVLHVVCAGTKFTAACVSRDGTAQGIFRDLYSMWFKVFGAPHRIVLDRERVLVSKDLEIMLNNEGVVIDPVPIEAHFALGIVERHHETLRCVCDRVHREHQDLSPNDVLDIATRAINVTTGPEGIIPSLLVFGTIPRLPLRPEVGQHDSRETQESRLGAMARARAEYEVIVSKLKLKLAATTRAPQFPGHNELVPGAAVLVRREEGKAWTGPFVCSDVNGDRARVSVIQPSLLSSDRARVSEYSATNVKLYVPPRSHALLCLLTNKPAQEGFEDADAKEMAGIVKHGILSPINSVPPGANLLGSRMDRIIKPTGVKKSRFVVQGFNDREASSVNVESPILAKYSFRLLVSVAACRDWELFYRDYVQAYLQSAHPLNRDVYLRLKDDVRNILSSITNTAWPKFAKLLRPLYGLTESGAYWYSTLTRALRVERFVPGALDPCVMHDQVTGQGFVGILVDDVIVAGEDACLVRERIVASNFEHKGLCRVPFVFNGFGVTRKGDVHFIDHVKYAARSLKPVGANSFEDFRALRGRLNYIATGTRPDILCGVALASQVVADDFLPVHWRRLMTLSRYVLDNPVKLRYEPLNINALQLRVFADASYASNLDHTSQIGFAIFLGDNTERVHYLHAQSNKCRQVAHSVLSAELLALCHAFDFAEAIQTELLRHGLSVPIVLATDSKQVFDSVTRSTTMTEKRLLVRMLVLRQGLADLRISQILHVPGALNIADALTKDRFCPLWARVPSQGLLAYVESASVHLTW